jgi:hypothetical protein
MKEIEDKSFSYYFGYSIWVNDMVSGLNIFDIADRKYYTGDSA